MNKIENTWYSNAIFYSLDVETYFDSNGDGIGDLQGLIQKLDYIAGLGASCIWLLPFYPSPNHDNGYDVMDYYNVDERLGTLGDFAELLERAEQLGIRIIIDLVVNHTSKEHPWFREARKDPGSPYRDFYIWSDEPLPFEKETLIFQGEENTVWTYDKEAGQYYLHRFYKEQPDLNIGNEKVQAEIVKIMGFWLRMGVSGFRIDAAEILVEDYGMKTPGEKNLVNFFNKMQDFAVSRKKDALLLAEVNAGPGKMKSFIESGERMHMLFNFFINQHLFLSLATEDKTSMEKALEALPVLHPSNQWLNFLRHHDELNLKLLDEVDQQLVFKKFAPLDDMRIYGFGIRRRLAPMVDNDGDWLRLAYSLLFSLPGVPLIRYGDEIGMGEDLSLEGRNSVRTPMQWTEEKNGGFTRASSSQMVLPPIENGEFGYKKVNELSAQHDPDSLLNWLERLINTRKQCPEIGSGKIFVIPCKIKNVFIHSYEPDRGKIIFLHNLSPEKVSIQKNETGLGDLKWYDVFGEMKINTDGMIELKRYGYCWLRAAN